MTCSFFWLVGAWRRETSGAFARSKIPPNSSPSPRPAISAFSLHDTVHFIFLGSSGGEIYRGGIACSAESFWVIWNILECFERDIPCANNVRTCWAVCKTARCLKQGHVLWYAVCAMTCFCAKIEETSCSLRSKVSSYPGKKLSASFVGHANVNLTRNNAESWWKRNVGSRAMEVTAALQKPTYKNHLRCAFEKVTLTKSYGLSGGTKP